MVDDSEAGDAVTLRCRIIVAKDAPTETQRMQSMLWTVALHSAAARRWLSSNPPRLDEVGRTLEAIENLRLGALSRQTGRGLSMVEGDRAGHDCPPG